MFAYVRYCAEFHIAYVGFQCVAEKQIVALAVVEPVASAEFLCGIAGGAVDGNIRLRVFVKRANRRSVYYGKVKVVLYNLLIE